jgi:hypothetical protein
MSDVQFHDVEAELSRQTLKVPVRETPQLILLHLERKQEVQRNASLLL